MGDHEATVRRYFEELFNEGDLDVADEILAPEVRYHGPPSFSPQNLRRREQVKAFVKRYHAAFPDINYHMEAVVGADDTYTVRWSAEGTHTDSLWGIEGTGKRFEDRGLNMFRFEGEAIAEIWSYWDTLGMVRELGLVSPVGMSATAQD
jgi:steroid delta-isomerase-like uncharacterized protein